MSALDDRKLRRFLDLAGEKLRGDWTIIGGVVLPILGVSHRVTVDIDIAGPDDAGMDQTLALMRLAQASGLAVEAIDLSAGLFLRQVRGWEDHLVEIHRGRRATIHIPDATLFVLLKMRRLTESDLSDCVQMLKFTRKRSHRVDLIRLKGAARRAMNKERNRGRRDRLAQLMEALSQA